MISANVKINKIGLNRNYYLIKMKGTLNQQPQYRELLYLNAIIKQLAVGSWQRNEGEKKRKSDGAMGGIKGGERSELMPHAACREPHAAFL
jgi:hypothetical protein